MIEESRCPALAPGTRGFEFGPDRATGAVFSPGRRYRYALWRTLEAGRGTLVFIGLNPSAADERHDDPTIRRCLGFAQTWGYRRLLVGNLFARCATRPERLRSSTAPVGLANDAWLERLAWEADRLVACWGTYGAYRSRDRAFAAGRENLYCLRRNRDGSPAHPLYIRRDQQPLPWGLPRP
jgi:hypothetical protein